MRCLKCRALFWMWNDKDRRGLSLETVRPSYTHAHADTLYLVNAVIRKKSCAREAGCAIVIIERCRVWLYVYRGWSQGRDFRACACPSKRCGLFVMDPKCKCGPIPDTCVPTLSALYHPRRHRWSHGRGAPLKVPDLGL